MVLVLCGMKKKVRWYQPRLKEYARQLRNDSTRQEIKLWSELKGKQVLGYRFTRQKPIGYYIFDFYCPALDLVIEVDGSIHSDPKVAMRDVRKEKYAKSVGLHLLRFENYEVQNNVNGVIAEIELWIKKHSTPS